MAKMSLHERATIWAAFATVKRVLGSLPRELKPATVAQLDKYLDDMDADMLRRVETEDGWSFHGLEAISLRYAASKKLKKAKRKFWKAAYHHAKRFMDKYHQYFHEPGVMASMRPAEAMPRTGPHRNIP